MICPPGWQPRIDHYHDQYETMYDSNASEPESIDPTTNATTVTAAVLDTVDHLASEARGDQGASIGAVIETVLQHTEYELGSVLDEVARLQTNGDIYQSDGDGRRIKLTQVMADGGVREMDPEIEPEFIGAHSNAVADTCQQWTGDPPEPCDNPATHTMVRYDGDIHEHAACDGCGEPRDVTDWARQWSTNRNGELVTDGGLDGETAADYIEGVMTAADSALTVDEIQKLTAVVDYLRGEEQTSSNGGEN